MRRDHMSLPMAITAAILLTTILCLSRCAPSRPHSGVPEGYTCEAKWMLDDSDPFDLSIWVFAKKDTLLVELRGCTGDDPKHPRRRTLDRLLVPLLPDSTWISDNSECECYLNGISNARVFAAVKGQRPGRLAVVRAWRVNAKTQRIEELDAQRVRCVKIR